MSEQRLTVEQVRAAVAGLPEEGAFLSEEREAAICTAMGRPLERYEFENAHGAEDAI